MAISIDWSTRVIYVPKTFLTSLGGALYELDINAFREALKDIEDNVDGIVNPDTHKHNTSVLLDGVTYARIIEIINGYTVTFEDGQYAVNLVGANSNIATVTNINQVSIRTSNSAGLIEVNTSGGDACDETEIHDALDSYTNKDDWKADVSNLSADVNVVEVAGSPVTSVDDFKADCPTSYPSQDVNVISVAGSDVSGVDDFKADISSIPADVWNHAIRTLTSEIGMTPAQEAKLDQVLLDIAEVPTKVLDEVV